MRLKPELGLFHTEDRVDNSSAWDKKNTKRRFALSSFFGILIFIVYFCTQIGQ